MSIKPSEAEKLIEVGLVKARAVDSRPVTVVIVDAAGELAAVGREETAGGYNFDLAFAGAATGALFGRTGDELERIRHMDFFVGLVNARGGNIAIFKGIVPLKRGDEVIGAVSVSGATAEHDLEIAEACAAALT